MALPSFIIVGAQKAGTTWLASMLGQHPDVFVPTPIETHFFDSSENYARGLDWYESRFANAAAEQVIGEKTPDYFWTNRRTSFHSDIPKNIRRGVPDVKLVLVLRNPVDRVISAVNHHVMQGRISPFVDVEALLTGDRKAEASQYGILERGHYARELERFLEVFDRDSILILLYEEDIIHNSEKTLRDVFSFLDVATDFQPSRLTRKLNKRMNSRQGVILNYYFPKLRSLVTGLDRLFPKSEPVYCSPELRKDLTDYYAPLNRELELLLGRDIEEW